MNKNRLYKSISGCLCLILLGYLLLPGLTKGGQYKYDNYYWLPANLNLTETDFSNICYVDLWDELIVTTTDNKLYGKNSYENQWTPIVYPKDLQVTSITVDPGGRIVLLTQDNLWYKDKLQNDWIQIKLPSDLAGSAQLEVLSAKQQEFILAVKGMQLSIYQNEVWKILQNPNQLMVQTIIYQPDQKRFLAGTEGNGLWAIDWDSGVQKKMDLKPDNASLSQIFIPINPYNASFASTEEGNIYRSLDGGESWQMIGTTITNNTIYHFCEDETTLGVFFALTKLGLYLTSDQGDEWIQMQHGIEDTETKGGVYHPSEQRFYLVTTGKGIRYSFKIPNKPAPIKPLDGDDVFYFRPTLAWELFGGNNLPGSYRVVLSDSPGFESIIFEKQNIMGDSVLVTEGTLRFHRKYFWKVRVETEYWNSDWTKASSFTPRHQWKLISNQGTIHWNEKKFVLSDKEPVTPYLSQNVFYIPLRSYMETIKAKISWDPAREEITIIYYEKILSISIREPNLKIQIKKNRAYIPAVKLAKLLDWTILWDGKTSTLTFREIKEPLR